MLLILRIIRSVGHIRGYTAAGSLVLDRRESIVDHIKDRHTNDHAGKKWMVYALHHFDPGFTRTDRNKSTDLASCAFRLFRGGCHCATSAARHTCRYPIFIINMKVRVADNEDADAALRGCISTETLVWTKCKEKDEWDLRLPFPGMLLNRRRGRPGRAAIRRRWS